MAGRVEGIYIAAEHGGTAAAANAPGGGATFTLALPVQRRGDGRTGRQQ